MEELTVFVDESGNAGANLLDRHPLFALAAVAARDADLPSLDNELTEAFGRAGLTVGDEVKGSYAIRHDLHSLITETTNLVLSAGQPVFWDVLERRFMIAAIIVDNLYDYVYNDSVGAEWTYPSDARQDLANHFYNHLSEPTLRIAAKSLVEGHPAGIRQLIGAIQRELADKPLIGSFDAVAALLGVPPHIEDLCRTLATVYSRNDSDPLTSHKGTAPSPNFTSFFGMLNRVEDHYRECPGAKVKIMFDSSDQFDEAFAHLHQLLLSAREAEILFPGRPPIIFGFKSVTSFATGDSRLYPFLQMADLFAAGIRSVFELFASPNQPSSIPKSLQFFLAFVAVTLDTPLFHCVISDSLMAKMWPTVERYAP